MQEIDHSANPFPGLRPFESTETHLFFGRDGQSEELLRRLKRTRFLAVVGTSGSGKSSLVRAGLLPALQGGLMASAGSDWRIAILRPGSDPIGNLARALTCSTVFGSTDEKGNEMQAVLAETTLRRSSLGLAELVTRARTKLNEQGQSLFKDYENLLVVVDQFEELFRFKQLIEHENSSEDAAAFVKLLLEAVGQKTEKIYIVLTMRSDFLGDCSQFWELPEAINNGQYLIPRMTRDERRQAISGPVAVGQGTISEPLVNQLLNDVGDNPDQLPILQHALMRTWNYWVDHHRNGNPIDIPDYNAIGGMAEALSRHADEAYAELNDGQKRIAEKLFKGLTEKGADNREIRRPMEVGEICDLTGANEAAVIAVVEVFRREGRSFLMPPPTDALTGAPIPLNRESLIDISHESLIRNWERLKKWTEEEAQSARIYKRLAETAVLHRAGEEALLVDPALQGALDWREKTRPNAVWARRYHPEFETALSFLDQSVAARDAETRERELRRKREVTYRRSRWILLILGLAFALSLASLTFAYSRLNQANSRLDQAKAERSIAEDQRTKAEEALTKAKAAEAAAISQFNQAKQQETLAAGQAKRATEDLAEAKEQSRIAKAERAVALKEKQEAEIAKAQAEHQKQESLHLLYAADINLAQQAYESNNIERVRELLAEAPNSTGADTRGFEWRYLNHLLEGENSSRKGLSTGLLASVTSPDGNTLVIGQGAKVIVRSIAPPAAERALTLPEDFSVGSLAISPDGKKLALGHAMSNDGATVLLYDTQTLKPLQPTSALNSAGPNTLVFSSNDQLVVGENTGSVSIWDLKSGKSEILPAKGTVFLDVSRDGKMIAAGSINDATKTYPVLLWEISDTKKAPKELLGHGRKITSVAFSPDGEVLATGSMDRTVRLWDPKTGYPVRLLSFTKNVTAVAFSRRGHFLAIGFEDGSIKLYDARENLYGPTLLGHHWAVTFLSFATGRFLFSSDNKLFSRPEDDELFFSEDNQGETTIKEWDVGKLTYEHTVFRSENISQSRDGDLLYSPDGNTLFARTGSHSTFFNAGTNRASEKPAKVRTISPDGKLMATVELEDAKQVIVIRNASSKSPIGGSIKGEKEVSCFAFSPDSRFLITCSEQDGVVKIWDTASSQLVTTLPPGEKDLVLDLSFITNNRVVVLYESGMAKIWDIGAEKPVSQFQLSRTDTSGMLIPTHHFAVSPDGLYLVATYGDGIAVLYDMKGKPRATFKCQAESAPAVAFSRNGKLLATGNYDGTLKLWDMTSHRELLTLKGTPYDVISIAFSPDETKLAILDSYGYLRVWHAPMGAGVATESKPASSGR